MGLEELRNSLAEGKLTKEQFQAEVKKLLDAGTITQEVYDAEIKGIDSDDEEDEESLSKSAVEKMIAEAVEAAKQSAADQVRTEYSQKLKDAEAEKERLMKEKMTEEERAKYEREEYEKKLTEREAALNAREVEIHTTDKLIELKLPMTFKPFFVSSTKEEADKNVELFAAAWQSEIEKAVEAKFKENGTDPGGKGGGKGGAHSKKWDDMTLTEQGKLFREEPEKAKKLAAAAGVKL